MNRWIRWQGLVAFLGVTISICLILFLVVDTIVKRVIENSGTKIVGAKVELEKADMSLFPAGLTLFGLQVTDPEEPMKNAVEIGRIAGTLDSLQLLRRKVIVNEMSVEGVRFGTQRIRSGAISKKTEKDGKDEKKNSIPGLPIMKLPDIQVILGKENLQTVKLIQSIRTDIEGRKELWTKNITELPGKEKIDGYKMQAMSFTQNSSMPLKLEKGDANLNLNALLSKGFIDATVAAKLQGVHISAGGTDADSGFGKAISSALSGVSTVGVKARITGPSDNYQAQISSNLDEILKNAVGSIIKDQVALFENKLRAAISDRVSGPLQEAKGSLGGFESLGGELESRISQLTGMQGGGAQKQPQLGGFQLPFKLPVP